MNFLSRCVLSFWLITAFICISSSSFANTKESFLDSEEAFIPSVTIVDDQLQMDWYIAKDYFLYRHGFAVEATFENGNVSKIEYRIPVGEKKYDLFFELDVETYHDSVNLISDISAYAGKPFDLTLTSQGCADKGLCFPPTTYHFNIDKKNSVMTSSGTKNIDLAQPDRVEKDSSSPTAYNLGITILGALLGGLILNLMPCVFPVLSLKALSFASGHESKKAHRRHGWSYTLGVLSSFLLAAIFILVARSTGQSLGWGFQLQHPIFITLMAYLFFVMGLLLSGAFEFGGAFMGLGQQLTSGNSLKSSFFTGVLAALVASPCTAPFMATALGVALTQSAPVALVIFSALGFGMALPFLALSYSPALSQWLPKPGIWMENFKQALSFPMYLTVIWLLWVLSHQTSNEMVILTLTGMLLIVLALWVLGISPNSRRFQLIKNGMALTVLIPAVWIAASMSSSPHDRSINTNETYTEARLESYRVQGKPVFVDLTADWCLTCKVNEKIALTASIKAQFQQHDITVLVGDWTNKNPEITKLLTQYKRSGIPLYLMYPVGGGEPELLPQLLTEGIVENAIARALP
ncbi:protein-disulfide reductase DsbD family protein [Gilvimarinus polysaccharolyticus]|uniref:protein-disulfide reductase DsbD family protein n=1 Tax=Gilvimarinus polysaccharolyticus TaxID=863921 RepID=UPI0006735600|nr:protein-disulfide reductase DsbD [Gilvimarinus polysaccharolyticus]